MNEPQQRVLAPLVNEQLTEVIRLAGSEVRAAPSSIHDLRVGLKRLRAWLQLLRPALGRQVDVALANRRLRDAGRMLSASRDAQVLSKTLRRIQARTKGKSARRIEQWRGELAELQQQAIPWDTVRTELALCAHMLHGVDWRAVSPDELRDRLQESYRRSRRLSRQALRRRRLDDERLHDFRKSVKRLAYQVEYLDQVFGRRHRCGGGLTLAGQNLGEVNDLLLLRRWLRDKGQKPDSKLLKLVNKEIRARHAGVRKQCAELFASGGRRFVAQYPPVLAVVPSVSEVKAIVGA